MHRITFGRLFACVVLLGLAAQAQVVPASGSLISGIVMNPCTGDPVAAAKVELLQGESTSPLATVKTDASGHFYLSNVAPGSYRVAAERPEFLRNEFGARAVGARGQTISLSAGKNVTDLKITLAPMGVITGTVFGEDGDPLAGAMLLAVRVGDSAGASSISQVARTTSDDRGIYRLHGLPPGRYLVKIAPSGRPGHSAGATDSASFFYPHAGNAEQATAFEIAPGSVIAGTDFALTPVRTIVAEHTTDGVAISGRITNWETGGGVSKARVELSASETDPNANVTVTDGAGYFSLGGVAAGQYHVEASRAGFMANTRGSTHTLTVAAGRAPDEVALALQPEAVLAGHVLDGNAPVVNAIVIASRVAPIAGHRRLRLVNRTYTNDLGEYRLFGLPPGRYFLSASYRGGIAPGSPRSGEANSDDYVTTFYPEALSILDAVPLDVTPGSEQTALDISLFQMRKLKVSGQFQLPRGERFTGELTAVLIPLDSSVIVKFAQHSGTVNPDTGSFEIKDVPAGPYVLSLEARTATGEYSAAAGVAVGKNDVSGLAIPMVRAFGIRGRISVIGQDKADLSSITVNLSLLDSIGAGQGGNGFVEPDGSFVVDNLRPGRYAIELSGLGDNLYLKSVAVGPREMESLNVALVSGAAELGIVLSPSGGKIDGVVVDDQHHPVGSGVVVLIPNRPLRARTDLYQRTSADETGVFHLSGITPGCYKLFAWDDMSGDSYFDDDFLATFEGLGQSVEVDENGHRQTELPVILNGTNQ
jgi:protocatechuate 3,4-dioxygenase beta subunit